MKYNLEKKFEMQVDLSVTKSFFVGQGRGRKREWVNLARNLAKELNLTRNLAGGIGFAKGQQCRMTDLVENGEQRSKEDDQNRRVQEGVVYVVSLGLPTET